MCERRLGILFLSCLAVVKYTLQHGGATVLGAGLILNEQARGAAEKGKEKKRAGEGIAVCRGTSRGPGFLFPLQDSVGELVSQAWRRVGHSCLFCLLCENDLAIAATEMGQIHISHQMSGPESGLTFNKLSLTERIPSLANSYSAKFPIPEYA